MSKKPQKKITPKKPLKVISKPTPLKKIAGHLVEAPQKFPTLQQIDKNTPGVYSCDAPFGQHHYWMTWTDQDMIWRVTLTLPEYKQARKDFQSVKRSIFRHQPWRII